MASRRPTGIINPFEEPKEAPPATAPYEDRYGLEEEEAPLRPKPQLDLDGDSYVIRFTNGPAVEDVASLLLDLLYEVNRKYPQHLERNGVHMESQPREGYLTLRNSRHVVSVYSDSETTAFRRIGMCLWTLPDKTLLQKHNVKVIRRM